MRGYAQYCPVAKATEVLDKRALQVDRRQVFLLQHDLDRRRQRTEASRALPGKGGRQPRVGDAPPGPNLVNWALNSVEYSGPINSSLIQKFRGASLISYFPKGSPFR